MADRKHKCLPPPLLLSLFFFLWVQHSDTNWVIGTIPPSVRDRSPSVSHSSTAETPAGLRTCAHNHTTYTHAQTHTHRGTKLTSVNNQSKWRAADSLGSKRRGVVCSDLEVFKGRFAAHGGNTVADELPGNWLTSAKDLLNHNQD